MTYEQAIEKGFRPQQGLTIMNMKKIHKTIDELESFRPQQGLTIMNKMDDLQKLNNILFPSPTGVNYYESLPTKP